MSHLYQNVCWSCGDEISSDMNIQCPICGWYICNKCGACHIGECVNIYTANPGARNYLRRQFAESNLPVVEFSTWCKKEIEKKHEESKNQNIGIKENNIDKTECKSIDEEKLWSLMQNCPAVTHKVFGDGHVTKTYISDNYKYITVHFNITGDEINFWIPDIFKRDFISLK